MAGFCLRRSQDLADFEKSFCAFDNLPQAS
jgi:hypothetical protein